jgi:hypothetical protein
MISSDRKAASGVADETATPLVLINTARDPTAMPVT